VPQQSLLIRGGSIVSMDPAIGNLAGDLLVVDGRIERVGPDLPAADAEIIEAAGMIVLPGLVDTHRHTWQAAVRHRGGSWDLNAYFGEMFMRLGPRFRPEDVYAGNLLGALAALDSGITTLVDWSHIVQNSPEHSDAAIKGLRDAGIRAVFAYGWPGTDIGSWVMESTRPHPDDMRRIRSEHFSSDDDLLTLAMAARGPEFSTMDVVAQDLGMARDLGARVTMHIGDGEYGPKYRGIERMAAAGLLGPDLTFVHVCTASDAELDAMAEHGVSASVSPHIEAAMAGIGVPAIGRLLQRGIQPSLSVDSETAAPGDMFSQMRAALTVERLLANNQLQADRAAPPIGPEDVLRFATLEGARAAGLDGRTGSLSPGKQADVILLRGDALNLAPLSDPIGAVVIAAHPGNVDTVLVNGHVRKRSGRLVGQELSRVLQLAQDSREYLLQSPD
jgi:5-methylthioadenosine/S-adenosylhomocysteine deaminase